MVKNQTKFTDSNQSSDKRLSKREITFDNGQKSTEILSRSSYCDHE